MNKVISLALILFLLSSCASRGSVKNMSLAEREVEMGNAVHREILSSFSVFSEPKSNGYVTEITQLLGKVSGRPQLSYQCTVLYSDKIYATVAPGGHVYVTTGMINFLENESELAGVIAHEVGEVQYKNPKYSGAKKAMGVLETAAGLTSGFFGPIGMLAFAGVAALNHLTDEKGLETRVMMADRKALGYMVKSGYDPQGLVDVLNKILYADDSTIPYLVDYYQSRPVNALRMKRLHKAFGHLDLTDKSFETHRDNFLSMTDGVKQLYLSEKR